MLKSSSLNLKSAERVLTMIARLPSWLKTICSILESKSVNAVLGTQTQEVENLLATAASIIAERFDLQ